MEESAHLDRLISELDSIRYSAFCLEEENEAELSRVCDTFRDSARNLLHYLALRRRDMRSLQEELATLGLSSLGRAESHVLGNIEQVLSVLHRLRGGSFAAEQDGVRAVARRHGRSRLTEHTDALFGHAGGDGGSPGGVRTMVTMPLEAAERYELVRDLVASGMDCMRINCASEDATIWGAMIEHMKRATLETGRPCAVEMDLGGPKIRTGPVELGPRVVHWSPKWGATGKLERPALIWLTEPENTAEPPPITTATVPLDPEILAQLREADCIEFKDLRGRARELTVRARLGSSWIAESSQITYLGAACKLRVHRPAGDAPPPPGPFKPVHILPLLQYLELTAGDTVLLTRDTTPATPVVRDIEGRPVEEPRIACMVPEVFRFVSVGDPVLFDDGKIIGTAIDTSADHVRVRVEHPMEGTKKLRADKGINFPESHLALPALTPKDLQDLDFAAKHADMIALSFVNRPEDVHMLQREIGRRTGRQVGIVLKIETRQAFEQLPRLLLAAMQSERVGVMIARGDLAVECGYRRLAELQEEILWICEAAHVPVIWATEVLDRLRKKGLPTRAEITDAAMGERAECIMLNKGPHVVEAVQVLSDIVRRMRGHQEKKSPMLRALKVSEMLELPTPGYRGAR